LARTPRPLPADTEQELDPSAAAATSQDGSSADENADQTGDENLEQEQPEPDEGAAVPSEAALDAIDELEANSTVRENQAIADSETKLLEVVTAYPNTTPNEHVAFGFGGRVINLGDLRNIAAGIRDKYRS
jgi:hypothetical protein